MMALRRYVLETGFAYLLMKAAFKKRTELRAITVGSYMADRHLTEVRSDRHPNFFSLFHSLRRTLEMGKLKGLI